MLHVPQVPTARVLRSSASCPNMNNDISLPRLLAAHRLPVCDTFDDGPAVPEHKADFLPPTLLRQVPDLLNHLHRRLSEVSNLFAPNNPASVMPGPSEEDTKRIKERLTELTEPSRLAASARRALPNTNHVEYIVKYLLRPLNEILSCSLLSTGLQMYWRLSTDPDRPNQAELIYAPANHSPEVIAFAVMMTPTQLPDSTMRMLNDSIRCQMMKVDQSGQVVISPPLPPSHRSNSCLVVEKMISQMFSSRVKISVITNCNRFMAMHHCGPTMRGEEIIEFSDLVSSHDSPGEKMTESPLGLFLGLTVFALHKRGLSLRANFEVLAHATTTTVLKNFMKEDFGKAEKRNSHDLKLKRRARLQQGKYPTQLGRVSLSFRLPFTNLEEGGYLSPATRSSISSMTNPFYGPVQDTAKLPRLLPDVPGDAWFIPELELVTFRGKGDLWDVFSARFAWLPKSPADLVVKFCNLSSFVDQKEDLYVYSTAKAEEALRSEISFYTGPLADLQGIAVPRFLGLLGSCQPGDNQVWCSLFEDVGMSLTPGDGIHPGTRAEIRRLYQRLHAAGVLHHDLGWRHILRGSDGHLKLISFDRARLRKREDDKEWAFACNEEMVVLDRLLGEGSSTPDIPQTDVGFENSDYFLPPTAPFALPKFNISLDRGSKVITPKVSFDFGSGARPNTRPASPWGTPKATTPRETPRTSPKATKKAKTLKHKGSEKSLIDKPPQRGLLERASMFFRRQNI